MGDYSCMLRAYQRNIVNAMLQCPKHSAFIPILAKAIARRTIEISVAYTKPKFGDSKYSFMKLINLMCDLLICLTTTPLRLLSIVSGFITVSGFLLAVLLIILRPIIGVV